MIPTTIILLGLLQTSLLELQAQLPATMPVESPKLAYTQRIDDEYIVSLIKEKSKEYGVDPSIPMHIVDKESRYNPKAKGDKNYICKKTGKIAPSHGLVQINECWNPDITLEQAHDIEFSIDFLVKNISQGKCYLWSTCPLNNPNQVE